MSRKNANLKPAHQGYRYQDILSAYFLVLALVDHYDCVIIDDKQVDDDRFDDIEVTIAGLRIRRQVKSSTDPNRCLKSEDFLGGSSSLRIDRLLLTARQEPDVREYRLCATWGLPEIADPLFNMLQSVKEASSVSNSQTACFRLKPDLIWPSGSDPVWARLSNTSEVLTRDEFIKFCQIFLIELQLPQASTNLLSPGSLEKSVIDLLSNRVGIGRYPNQSRTSSDVAALATALATLARTQGVMLNREDIANYLELQLDYGRVAQAFPIDKSRFYNRPAFRQSLRNAVKEGGIHLVTAPPGSGKSWDLTKLANELALETGVIVARHYCYLEPGDEQVERRITSDVFFANLIAELFDAAPELKEFPRLYAADLNTLETALLNAHNLEKEVVLIVDGLDHIARILAGSDSLSDDEVDIVEQLATISLPAKVSLVLGSQPGNHLQILHANVSKVTEHHLPSWSKEDLIGLARVLSLPDTISAALLMRNEDVIDTLEKFAESSDGNPLYARYLSQGLIYGVQVGLITNPNDWLESSPNLQGNIATYYQHLYTSISSQAQAIADIIGTIDFSVSEDDLKQILPEIMHDWIPQALTALSPVLTSSTTQGGVRIFHESFRRFMLDDLVRQGRQLMNVLTPVITWLEQKGFYANAKSYRFLLPLLRRANRSGDVLNYVSTDFVSQSVSHAHPSDAIQRNLALAAEIAARIQDWAFLVRCAELRRMLSTCFDEGNNSWYEFWNTYAHLHGPEALAERLLFDGKPTQGREDGLRACKIVDDLGAVAPWQIYLDIPIHVNEHTSNGADNQTLSSDELVVLATIQGHLRTGNIIRILRRVFSNLILPSSSTSSLFVYELSKLLARFGCESFVLKLACRGDILRPEKFILRADFSTSLRIGVADELNLRGHHAEAIEVATLALRTARTPASIMSCIERKAHLDKVIPPGVDPTIFNLGFGNHYIQDDMPVSSWVSAIRLQLMLDPSSEIRESELDRVNDRGWYRCWLKYVIAIAEAEAAAYRDIPYEIQTAFIVLAEDVQPFAGNPRACDLYSIRYIIEKSLERGLALVHSKEDFEFVITRLMEVSRGTASRIDKEDGGPLTIGTLIDILMPYVIHSDIGEYVRSVIATLIDDVDDMGTYYSTHATYTMSLAKVLHGAGRADEARECWTTIGKYLTSYGWRKDITLFDIIESVPSIAKSSQQEAIQALIDLQPLIAAVLRHTDGRSTKRAPNAWVRSLLEVDPSTGVELIAKTILEQDGEECWVTLQAVKDTLESFLGIADPLLLNAVWDTISFRIEYDNAAGFEAEERLNPLRLLFKSNPEIAKHRVYRLAAEITNNETTRNKEAVDMLNGLAAEQGMLIHCMATKGKDNSYGHGNMNTENLSQIIYANHPELIFNQNDTNIALLCAIRKLTSSLGNIEQSINSAVQYLSYRLPDIIEDGDEAGARRIVRFLAHELDLPYSLKRHPLLDLAICLENAGYSKLAAMAHTLAYTSSRGGDGWLNFGDKEHSSAMDRAIQLDRDIALQTIADEVGRRLRHMEYGAGISRHLIERIAEWNQPEIAVRAWKEAFAVISQRLPLGLSYGWLAKLEADGLSKWTPDEGLVALLLVRLGEPRISRKISSLCGLLNVIKYRPDALPTVLEWWLSRDTPISSILLVLNLLYFAEKKPYNITQTLSEQLRDYARTDCWGIVMLANVLLRRLDLPVPVQQSYVPKTPPMLSANIVQKLHMLDEGNNLKMLATCWSDLPILVGNKYSQLENNAIYSEKFRARFELAYGRNGESKPPTEVLLWQQEIFLIALHTEMMGFKEYLWGNGMWSEDIEINTLYTILPKLNIHMALWSSRVCRPDWVLPKDTTPGVFDLKTLSSHEDRFSGWVRLGLLEHQFINGDSHSKETFETIFVMSGVIASPLGHAPQDTYDPFNTGSLNAWWKSSLEGVETFTAFEPLLMANRIQDWMGDEIVMAPTNILHSVCNPSMPDFGEALIWKDDDNKPILALRTWFVKRSQYDNEPDQIRGQDVIIRPDILQKIKDKLCCSFFEVTWVEKT